MKDTEYTFAVARIRSNENKLLNSAELSSVISAPSYEDAVNRLNDKGYGIEGKNYSPALSRRLNDFWKVICEVLPDKSQFDSVILKNDFANLKTAVKSYIAEKSTDGLFITPSVYPPEEIKQCVFNKQNSLLPQILQTAEEKAYTILSKTRFAQFADSVVDTICLEKCIELAKKGDNPILEQLAQVQAACCNIKVLYRCILAEKDDSFMNKAVAHCNAFEKDEIIKAAQKGMDDYLEFLSHTDYKGAAEALKISTTEFERWCDNKKMSLLSNTKTEVFGIGPIVAFYIAAQTEISNVRIILSAKQNGLSEEIIRARVRESYV